MTTSIDNAPLRRGVSFFQKATLLLAGVALGAGLGRAFPSRSSANDEIRFRPDEEETLMLQGALAAAQEAERRVIFVCRRAAERRRIERTVGFDARAFEFVVAGIAPVASDRR